MSSTPTDTRFRSPPLTPRTRASPGGKRGGKRKERGKEGGREGGREGRVNYTHLQGGTLAKGNGCPKNEIDFDIGTLDCVPALELD